MPLRRSVFLIACGLSCFGPLPGWQKPTQLSVEFLVTDGYGIPVKPDVTIEVIPASGAAPAYIADYPRVHILSLPRGSYVIVARARGFLSTTKRMIVMEEDLFVLVPLVLAPIESPPGTTLLSRLSGKLTDRFEGDSPMWVRVVGVYNDVDQTAKIEDGSFVINKLPPGRYSVMVFGKGTLKESKLIDLRPPATSINIE